MRVLGCGVCGTDAHIYEGHIADARPPVVLGHEICGRVEQTGPQVRGLAHGETVAVDPFVACGECPECRRGERRFCRREIFLGYHRHGGFAQFCSVPAVNLYRLPPGLSPEGGILVETLATVVAGLHRLAPQPGRRFLVLGPGAVGMLWAQLLRLALPICLIQTEIVPERLARARAPGTDLAFSPHLEEMEAAVRRLCPDGVDYLIDATGSTEAVTARPASCPEPWNCWPRGAVDPAGLVTGRYPLAELESCFCRFNAAKDRELKMMIDPWA